MFHVLARKSMSMPIMYGLIVLIVDNLYFLKDQHS